MAKTSRKRCSGSARMKGKGLKPLQVWLTPSQIDLVRRAAQVHDVPMTSFVTAAGLALALSTIAPDEPVIVSDASGPAIVVAEERDGQSCVFALEGGDTR